MNSYKLIIKEKTQPLKRNIDEEHKLMINWKVNMGVPVVQKKKEKQIWLQRNIWKTLDSLTRDAKEIYAKVLSLSQPQKLNCWWHEPAENVWMHTYSIDGYENG